MSQILYSKIEGQGKPLLILHGLLGMSDNWKSIGSKFAENGFEVHLLDLRNHGRSLHSEDFDYKVMANDILDYCKHLQLESIDLMGHSMGGKVAMQFATTYPDLVNKLIIVDIGPKQYPLHHQEILAGLNAVDFSIKPDRGEVEETLLPYIPDFGTRQFLMKSLYWVTSGQLAFRFNLDVFNQKIEEVGVALPLDNHFDKPTLFIRGGKSNYILDSDLPQIRNQFPNYTLITIPDVGHWLHAEKPQVFFQESFEFLT